MYFNQRKAGVILSYMGQSVKILVNLLYTPVMLRLIGQSEYGLYQLVYSVVSYLSLLSLGFGGSYMRFYSRYKANEDEEGIAMLNGMFISIFLVMSFICFLCGSVMLANIRGIFGVGLTDHEYETAKILMVLIVFNLTVTFPNSVFNCFITAHEKFLFQKSLVIIESVCSPFLTLPLLIMGYGSIGMVSASTFLTIGIFAANAVFCLKKLRMKFNFRGFQFSLLKEMWVFTFFVFLNQIIDMINWSVDKFLLGRMVGTTAVAVYGIGSQINSMYLQFSTSISSVFIPHINKVVAESDDNRELTRLFTKVGRIQFIVLMLILSGFIFFGQPFIKFWAGENYSESYIVALLLIIPITVPLIQNLGIEIQRAKNKHKARAVVYVCIAIGNIFLSIPLIKIAGASGAAMGTTISLIIGNVVFMNWYYHKKIGLNIISFWQSIMRIFPALILPGITGILLMKYIDMSGIISFILSILTYTITYGVSMWLFGFNNEEKNIIYLPLKKIMKW